jgi:hypothetical protein
METEPMQMRAVVVALAFVASIVAVPLAQKNASKGDRTGSKPDGKLETLKQESIADVESRKDFAQQMVDQIFSYGELGFQEFETNRYLIDILKTNGFTVQEGVAGVPTAFVASWGSGKPVLALGSDIDCIPQASQKPGVAYHDPIIEGAPGHGEGHNSGQAVNIVAALAVKEDHGTRAHVRDASHLDRHGRGARRDEGVFRSRRIVQGRRRGAVHTRRRSAGRLVGSTRWHRPRIRRVLVPR